jgi:hypothetical protein
MLLFIGCAAAPTRPAPVAARAATPEPNAGPQIASSKTVTPADTSSVETGANWQPMFDGKTLQGWAATDFAGHGNVEVENGAITLGEGVMTGVTWTNAVPEMNYEIALEAMRVDGSDFFCGLTFPVGTNPCSLIVGGWGGAVVGLSSLDGEDAANNETTKVRQFQKGRWYTVKVRVEPSKIQAWIDGEKYVDVITTDRKISIRAEVELSKPLGVASWSTRAALRNIRIRKL